jgi:hypothetical protein
MQNDSLITLIIGFVFLFGMFVGSAVNHIETSKEVSAKIDEDAKKNYRTGKEQMTYIIESYYLGKL